jgi:amide synthase
VKFAGGPPQDGPELYSRALADGQVVLKGRRHLTVRSGIEKVRTIVDDGEWDALRSEILRPRRPAESTEEE